MRPIQELSREHARVLQGVLFDIDDTFSTEGRITAEAYQALERLKRAGLLAVPITGRPAGWCDHIARMWPVDAVVGENGAFYFAYDGASRKIIKRFCDDVATRAAHRARIAAIAGRILAEIPGSAMATDQAYRETDLAIDYCEDVPRLADADIDRVVQLMQEAGMSAKVSSIHVNGWFGAYDKLGMTRTLMRERWNVDLDLDRARWVFIGDSPNDAPMFEYFPLAVGVANVRDFGDRLAQLPAFVTTGRSGAGFVELVEHLCGAHSPL